METPNDIFRYAIRGVVDLHFDCMFVPCMAPGLKSTAGYTTNIHLIIQSSISSYREKKSAQTRNQKESKSERKFDTSVGRLVFFLGPTAVYYQKENNK